MTPSHLLVLVLVLALPPALPQRVLPRLVLLQLELLQLLQLQLVLLLLVLLLLVLLLAFPLLSSVFTAAPPQPSAMTATATTKKFTNFIIFLSFSRNAAFFYTTIF